MRPSFRPRSLSFVLLCACLVGIVLSLTACSTKKNTAGSRFWHSFTARYNTYFNGNEAYKEGLAEQAKGNADNYTALLPVFTVGNEQTQQIGKSKFETAIIKCEKAIQLHSIKRRPVIAANKTRDEKMRQYLKREEFNPFLKHAWMLMGKAQFQKGSFLEAASTFSYITRHYAAEPLVAAEARAWMARSYAQMNWLFDAEDALARLHRDSLADKVADDYALSMADLLVRQERLDDAVPYLERAVKATPSRMERARLYFLLGQVHRQLGHDEAAYAYLNKVLRMSPPHALALNARILQTEVISAQGQGKRMIARLNTMARHPNNKEYLDQIYYAIGNIHLSERDTAAAIAAYEQGRTQGNRSGVERGVLLFRLGGLYWDVRRFDRAQVCYGEALTLLGKEHTDYALTMRRSSVLDRLVPHTTAVHDNDSMLALVALPEAQRLAIIDRAIATERKRQRDSAATARSEEARRRAAESGISLDDDEREDVTIANRPQPKTQEKLWYFYNPATLQKGKQAFIREWGRRKLEDNWRRRNKTLLAGEATSDTTTFASTDSRSDEPAEDSVQAQRLSPLTREYYLAQLPFSDEAKAAAHLAIQEGLYNAGLIEKDELEDYPLAAETLLRLEREYPAFAQREELYYQLFLLYTRWGRALEADRYRQRMVAEYPQSKKTQTITHPNFEYNLTHGVQVEDSLYTATYAAFRRRDFATVESNVRTSAEEFPDGANRAKFLLLDALSGLGRKSDKAVAERLRSLVTQYPESDVSEMAAHLVKGIESGRSVRGGFDTDGLWSRRSEAAKTAMLSSKEKPRLSAERNTRFLFLAGFEKDTVNENLLLFDLANFNFTRFTARSFDIAKERNGRQVLFSVAGFRSYDEAHLYAQRLFAERALAQRLRRARIIIISERNYELIGTAFSIADYQKFYDRTFAPLKINPELPLDEPDVPEQKYEDVPPQPELPKAVAKDTTKVSVPPLVPTPIVDEPAEGEIIVPIEPQKPTAPTEKPEPAKETPKVPEEPQQPTAPTEKPEPAKEMPKAPEEPQQPTAPTEKPEPAKETPKAPEEPQQPVPPETDEEEEGEWYPI